MVIVNFSNRSFGWIKALQAIHSDRRYLSVDFSGTDHAAIARASGMEGISVDAAADLEDVLARALASGLPTLVDVCTESEEKDLPPVKSWRNVEASKRFESGYTESQGGSSWQES